MANATVTVSPNSSTLGIDRLPAKTSMRGLIDGTAPITLGKGLKAAFLKVTWDGGSYVTAGIAAGLLTALPGWTAILGGVPAMFTDTSLKIAYYDVDNDKFYCVTAADGSVHAQSALSGTFYMLVLGY